MVVWKAGGVETTGLFQALTVYRAEVTLYPAPGYAFPESVPALFRPPAQILI
jgi:hypothetical protein